MNVSYAESVLWHYVSNGSIRCCLPCDELEHSSEPDIEEPFSDLGTPRPENTYGQKLLQKAKENAIVGKRKFL